MSKNFSKWKNRPIPRFIRQKRNEIKTKEIANILNGIKTKKFVSLNILVNTKDHLIPQIASTREGFLHVIDCVHNVNNEI